MAKTKIIKVSADQIPVIVNSDRSKDDSAEIKHKKYRPTMNIFNLSTDGDDDVSKKKVSSNTLSLGVVTFLICFMLKITGVIAWNWFWVTWFLWFPIAYTLILFFFSYILLSSLMTLAKRKNYNMNVNLSLDTYGGGISLLLIIFLALKLELVVAWKWIWVVAPLWIPLALLVVLSIVFFSFAFIGTDKRTSW